MSDLYGPALPPGLQNKSKNEVEESESSIGPALPPGMSSAKSTIGPALPPTKSPERSKSIGPALPPSMSSIGPSYIGPVLPPGMSRESSESNVIGPVLPSNSKIDQNDIVNAIGPCLPPHLASSARSESSSDDDADVIGPLPSEMLTGDGSISTVAEIESRARSMKNKLEGKDIQEDKISRESWMTELPSAGLSQSIGLQARTFKARAGPDMSDRSSWTDTPADREKKAKEESSRKRSYDVAQSQRDQKMSEDVSKYNKSSRPESLYEMHQKKLKKEKKKTKDEPKERRPFDREVDLQVNRFDDTQRKAIIKKSRNLDTRFSHGGGSQFL